jgi:hypothetical protein
MSLGLFVLFHYLVKLRKLKKTFLRDRQGNEENEYS